MKTPVILLLLSAVLLLAACRSEKTPAADAPASVQDADASAGGAAPADAEAAAQGSATVLPPKPAEDLMFVDLEQGPKGMAYYRGHPFTGSVWMSFDRVYSCTYADGVVVSYTYFHSGGHVAAICSPKGKVQQCFDYEGLTLTPDSFARRYPDMQHFIDGTFMHN